MAKTEVDAGALRLAQTAMGCYFAHDNNETPQIAEAIAADRGLKALVELAERVLDPAIHSVAELTTAQQARAALKAWETGRG